MSVSEKPGPPRTPEQASKWTWILAARGRGLKWQEIAEESGLSERQCRRIYASHAHSASLFSADEAIREFEETIAMLDVAISDLAVIDMTTTRSSVKIAAIHEKTRLRERKLKLYNIAGALTPQMVRDDEVRLIIKEVIRVFEKYGAPREGFEEVIAALDRRGSGQAARSF